MRAIVALCAAALLGTLAASAQEKSAPQPPAPPSQEEPYQPGLGEIMALQQMRHIKLWFAGHAGNWPLADYEIGELNDEYQRRQCHPHPKTLEGQIRMRNRHGNQHGRHRNDSCGYRRQKRKC